LLVVILVAAFLVNNVVSGLRASNIPLGWRFLGQEAGFEIAEGMPFRPTESYARAFVVGLVNTLRVAVGGILLATLLGLVVGVARLSSNWLVRTLAGGYVEVIRNTPLLVQLFFWYFAVILKLPDIKSSRELFGVALVSNRGIALPWPRVSASGQPLLHWLVAATLLAILITGVVRRLNARRGQVRSGSGSGAVAFLVVAALGLGVSIATAALPANIAYTLEPGDRGQLFVDRNGNHGYDTTVDRLLPFVPVTLLAADGTPLGTTLTDKTGEYRFF
jgi:general L-amino acid transport system permease protein